MHYALGLGLCHSASVVAAAYETLDVGKLSRYCQMRQLLTNWKR